MQGFLHAPLGRHSKEVLVSMVGPQRGGGGVKPPKPLSKKRTLLLSKEKIAKK